VETVSVTGILSGLGEAIPAVYRLVAAGLEGNFSLFSALSAGGGIHLPGSSVAGTAAIITKPLGSSGRTASGAALGFIGESLGSEEFLFFDRKGERFSAIGAL
jgi:hypothetical protein